MSKVIVNAEQDTYNSFITNDTDYMTSPLYYYYLDNELAKDFVPGAVINNGALLSCCPAIINIIHAPFLDIGSVQLLKIPYDFETFGEGNGVVLPWEKWVAGTKKPSVYRIRSTDGTSNLSFKNKMELRKFNVYPSRPASVGGVRNWRNESKLYQYPYRYFDINDFYNTPLRIKPHLCKTVEITPYVVTTISNKATYGIGVKDYKNDIKGFEMQISSANLDLPVATSQYNQYYAENKNQINAQNNMNFISSIGSVATNLAYNNIAGAVGAGVGGLMQKEMLLAKKQDLLQAPRSIMSLGGDPYLGWMLGESHIYATEYKLQEAYARQLGDFFAMYGYKQLKVFKPNLRSRRDYNYIKTNGANIKGAGIPKKYFEKLKGIYDKGVTIWHMDRNDKPLDYSRDNVEV